MQINQNQTRKNNFPKYCARHSTHYITDCPYCSLESGEQTRLEVMTGREVSVRISDLK